MSDDDKKINVLYGYSKAKESPYGNLHWKHNDNYARFSNLKIIYELRGPEDSGTNMRVLRIQNGKTTVTDVVDCNIQEETGESVKIEKIGTERNAVLALKGLANKGCYSDDVGVSDKFSDHFGDENPYNSGILSADECKEMMRNEISKAKKINEVMDKLSAEELIEFANMKGKDCR